MCNKTVRILFKYVIMKNEVGGCVFSYKIGLNISISKTVIESLTIKEVISGF